MPDPVKSLFDVEEQSSYSTTTTSCEVLTNDLGQLKKFVVSRFVLSKTTLFRTKYVVLLCSQLHARGNDGL